MTTRPSQCNLAMPCLNHNVLDNFKLKSEFDVLLPFKLIIKLILGPVLLDVLSFFSIK